MVFSLYRRLMCLSCCVAAQACWEDDFDPGEDEAYEDGDPTPQDAHLGFRGVDILVVVDNSASMAEEQEILSSSMYTLINLLTDPTAGSDEQDVAPLDEVRVGVVTSDMGLQWGEDGEVGENTVAIPNCDDRGDDGELKGISPEVETIHAVSCARDIDGAWAETAKRSVNAALATQAACMVRQGTSGCGIEQQLKAGVQGARSNPSFLVDFHKLALLVVSDEEDCSIESPDLFRTKEWLSGAGPDGLLNVACNCPQSNEQYLFATAEYYDQLVDLKDGLVNYVVFAAIVGVPSVEGSLCQGTGAEIEAAGCLDDYYTEPCPAIFCDPLPCPYYMRFPPACTRLDASGVEVTSARPGRRFVELAQLFGEQGYVYSICNEDWRSAMTDIARLITGRGDD